MARTLPESCQRKHTGNSVKVRKSVLTKLVEKDQQLAQSPLVRAKIAQKVKKIKKGRKDTLRALSPHVSTRWYRSPEVCLVERVYDQANDIWALGCIFLELLTCHESMKIKAEDRTPLLMGNSCYPLSPAADSKDGTEIMQDD